MNFSQYLGLFREPDTCDGKTPPQGILNKTDVTRLYMDDIAEVPFARLKNVADWQGRNRARMLAEKQLIADLNSSLGMNFPARQLFSGSLGSSSWTQFVSVTNGIARFSFATKYMPGGEIIIRSIGLCLSESVTGQVINFKKVGSSNVLKTVTIELIQAQSKAQTALPEAWKVPLDGNEYEIVAQLPQGVRVAENNIKCGCRNVSGAMETLIYNCCAGKANGYMMMIGQGCKYDALFTQLMDNEQTNDTLIYMLAYKAGWFLAAGKVVNNGKVNRENVLEETGVKDAVITCETEYELRLGYLKVEVPKIEIATDYTCFSKARPFGWKASGLTR